ncbi:MAG: aminomethyl-transferring glycine dehydrogenase subunit GcvPA [Deltaproteobacteria bacterium]|nr:aminomethyl-transferring glycine dehydrogenase subunit GcvPA [Deltaproteobacteria bacterium]
MRYIPHTDDDISAMLDKIGVSSIEELFKPIPEYLRKDVKLILPEAAAEPELIGEISGFAGENTPVSRLHSFLGAGAYDHYIPSAIRHLLLRGEFYTAYTPYQSELSQGTLTSIFEFQTMIAGILGMDVANASMYDGASASAEAILMAQRITRRDGVLVSGALHPEFTETIRCFLDNEAENLRIIPFSSDGRTDIPAIEGSLGKDTAAVLIASPNFFGCIEEISKIAALVHQREAILITAFTEPYAFGLIDPPGNSGADITAGEGQSFGLSLNFGGPLLGLFACKEQYLKTIPGRLVGQAKDKNGRRSYVLTLAAREQHIRRERATSNICTNQGLCALAASIHLSLLGREGFKKISKYNHLLSEYLKKRLAGTGKAKFPFDAPTYNEFVAEIPADAGEFFENASKKGVICGFPLSRFFPEMKNRLLITVTEKNGIESINTLVRLFEEL